MTKIVWDNSGERIFGYGVHNCALYLDGQAVPWNGIISIEENFEETKTQELFFEGNRFITYFGEENLSFVVSAFTYPEEFISYIGFKEDVQGIYINTQTPKTFNMSYKTRIGNDLEGPESGYKIHVLYNMTALYSSTSRSTALQEEQAVNFSFELNSKPSFLYNGRPTSRVIIDSTLINEDVLFEIENILYGTETVDPTLPSLSDFVKYANEFGLIIVTLNGDGTWTATGPDEYFTMLDPTTFMITNMNGFFIDSETYQVSSSTD